MTTPRSDPRWRADAAWVLLAGLLARLLVVAWAGSRITPIADGAFYQTIAERIAAGRGYTWAWPDGTVTFAAHYPVGYPAALGAIYFLVGAHPFAGMVANAGFGALAGCAVQRVLARATTRTYALAGGLLVALHPGLVSYAPALMTEGAAASLVALTVWLALRASEAPSIPRLAATGVGIALSTYVRPETLLLVLLLPSLLTKDRSWRVRGISLAVPLATALVVVLPWTARNCVRMNDCALVSMNDGWNLLIGTDPDAHGTWSPLQTPEACRDAANEADQNRCFRQEAVARIAAHPGAWLALVPRKLAATFDYAGAGPWYLNASNPDAFSTRAKWFVGGAEVLFERCATLLGLIAVWRRAAALRWGLRQSTQVVVVLGALALLVPAGGWIATLALIAGLAALVWLGGAELPPVFPLALAGLALTALVSACSLALDGTRW